MEVQYEAESAYWLILRGPRDAHALQSNLEPEAEVRVWSQDVFLPGEHVLELQTFMVKLLGSDLVLCM